MSIPPSDSSFVQSYDSTHAITQNDKTMAMLAYLLGIVTSFAGPLILWLIKKDQSKFVAYHAMQAVLLEVAVFISYHAMMIIFPAVLGFVGVLLILSVFGIGTVALNTIAAIAANKGQWYEMPVVGAYARKIAGV